MRRTELEQLFTVIYKRPVVRRQIRDPLERKQPSIVFMGCRKGSRGPGCGVVWGALHQDTGQGPISGCCFVPGIGETLEERVVRSYRTLHMASASSYLDARIMGIYMSLAAGHTLKRERDRKYAEAFRASLAQDDRFSYTFEEIMDMVPAELEHWIEYVKASDAH
jgi:hypothetical protein